MRSAINGNGTRNNFVPQKPYLDNWYVQFHKYILLLTSSLQFATTFLIHGWRPKTFFAEPKLTLKSELGHEQHRARRAALNSFFSIASVRKLRPLVLERVHTLMERLRDFKDVKGDAGVIKADYAFAALTNGTPWPWNLPIVCYLRWLVRIAQLIGAGRCRNAICIRCFKPPT